MRLLTHGTAFGRIVNVFEALLDLDADASEALHFLTALAAPLRAYLLTTEESQVIPKDVEVLCDIVNIPAGTVDINFDEPGKFDFTLCPPWVHGLMRSWTHGSERPWVHD
jgi:hypothetical protein